MDAHRAAEILGISDAILQYISEAPTLDLSRYLWTSYVDLFKFLHKKQARTMHPDGGGSTEEFLELQDAIDTVLSSDFYERLWSAQHACATIVDGGTLRLDEPAFIRRM